MSKPYICRLLGFIALLLSGSMVLSLPWTLPAFGQVSEFDRRSFFALAGSMGICALFGGLLAYLGRNAGGQRLFRREAIAVVGLSWLMATLFGALPFWLSGSCRGVDADGTPIHMDLFDGLFESASGFSGTGATVLTDIENAELVPRAILFWRSETHFLGGLGIMVLFVAVLGVGSAGKTLMLTEMPGPKHSNTQEHTQQTARTFAMIFVGLTAILTVLLVLQGVSLFDSLCHSFGAIATGGFSTYNDSVEHFHSVGVEMTIALFMAIACVNFTLLYFLVLWKPAKLFEDVEFRVYAAVMALVSLIVVAALWANADYANIGASARFGVFQTVSIMTNTGFGTADFNRWNNLSRAVLLLMMFVGGCAGSTSCSIKVIRYVLFYKILQLELEQVFHPTVVRPVRLGGKPLDNPDIRKDVVLYFGVIAVAFVAGWIALVAVEPDETWVDAGVSPANKLMDCASAVAATLNGVGPGLGIVGESENYSHFHGVSKFVLTWLMLLGRLEVFTILLLFVPRFWRTR
jgi:trk system potassium uptake protein TrkH